MLIRLNYKVLIDVFVFLLKNNKKYLISLVLKVDKHIKLIYYFLIDEGGR